MELDQSGVDVIERNFECGRMLLVRRDKALPVRARLCVEVLNEAEQAILRGDAENAVGWARVGWLLDSESSVRVTAAYVAALTMAGDGARVAFHLRAAGNSYGRDFAEKVKEATVRLLETGGKEA